VLGADAQPIIDQLNQTGTMIHQDPPSALSNLQGSPLLARLFFRQRFGSDRDHREPNQRKTGENSSFATTLEHVTLRALTENPPRSRGHKAADCEQHFSAVAFSDKARPRLAARLSFNMRTWGSR